MQHIGLRYKAGTAWARRASQTVLPLDGFLRCGKIFLPGGVFMSAIEQDARRSICEAIAATLRRSGREVPEFKDQDEPIKNYDGFDSQCGLEVTVVLEELLGIEDLGTNIFVKEKGKTSCARNLTEIVDVVLVKLNTKRGHA
jgi:hypothetical protein